jgi:hypothetical protein
LSKLQEAAQGMVSSSSEITLHKALTPLLLLPRISRSITVSTRLRRRFFGGTDRTVTVSHLCRKCLFGPLSSHEPESNPVEHGFGSTLRESLLDHELRRLAVIALDEAPAIEQRAGVVHQRRATADHDAIMRGVERGQSDVAK